MPKFYTIMLKFGSIMPKFDSIVLRMGLINNWIYWHKGSITEFTDIQGLKCQTYNSATCILFDTN